jgi:hypothetical protein
MSTETIFNRQSSKRLLFLIYPILFVMQYLFEIVHNQLIYRQQSMKTIQTIDYSQTRLIENLSGSENHSRLTVSQLIGFDCTIDKIVNF